MEDAPPTGIRGAGADGEAAAKRARSRPAARRAGWIWAFAVVLIGAFLRIHTALADPNFDSSSAAGMLRSDPALLYYVTERILAGGGSPPADFRADPRIEHPDTTDIPATLAVGEEFFVAWGYRLFGGAMPLHVFCVWILGLWASLCALGVYGLTMELTGRASWSALAATLYAALYANYRTVGFILVNEDFSLPWFAAHLWLLARAVRVRTPGSIFLASLPLGLALSTWHAMGFFVALEAFAIFVWFVWTGANPLAARGAWILPATLLLVSVCVPVLQSTSFAVSLPMQLVLGLLGAAWWIRWRGGSRRTSLIVALSCWGAVLAVALLWARLHGGGLSDYSHVFGLMWEKVRHLGVLPADPTELDGEVRLMWQGPFRTLPVLGMVVLLGAWNGFLCLLSTIPLVARARRGDGRAGVLCLLTWLSMPVAWLIERTVVLPGLLLPIVGACAGAIWIRWRWLQALCAAVVLWQGLACVNLLQRNQNPWYRPEARAELAELVGAIPRLVPDGEAIAADFVNSPAILVHTGRPIVFQPKWESRRSRGRAVEFLTTFFHGTPEEMRKLLTGKYLCRYVLFDRFTLGAGRVSSYVGGVPDDRAIPGTCASVFLSQDPAALSGVPGYRLIYRSPEAIHNGDGSPTDYYRLYRIEP